jgi:tetratricopeptide (TPR) repeat protein
VGGVGTRRRWPSLLLLLGFLLAGPLPAADPFYVDLLYQGRLAYERKDYASAAEDLRVACFGFLEEPELLAEGLTRLALAQAGLGDQSGFRESFRRILEVEQRFSAYSNAGLPDQIRSSFEDRLVRWVPPDILEVSPTFSRLLIHQSEIEETETLSESRPVQGEAPAAEADPEAADEEPGESLAAISLSPAEEAALERARSLLQEARTTRDLAAGLELTREVADAHPESREAQHLMAMIAYRSSRWTEAADYFRRGGDPGDEQPALLFYMAVALYESGEHEEAAEVLRRALPGLQRTAYVDSYIEKILSEASR